MAYKVNFQPIEGLLNGQWQRLERSDEAGDATHARGA
jgi:arginyl-tRNA--protein-N-Asp/Glu arginylyltransferase